MVKRIGLVLILAFVVSAALLLYRTHPASVAASSSAARYESTALAPVPAPSASNTAPAMPEATPISGDGHQLAEELGELTRPWQSSLIDGPGWLHTVYRVEHPQDEASTGILPNGQAIPSSFVFDAWYELDANNSLVSIVSLMLDLDGNLVQVATYTDGWWQNLTTEEEPYRGAAEVGLDFHFARDLELASTWQSQVGRQESVSPDGHALVTFEMRDTFTPPQSSAEYSAEIAAISRRLIVDVTTGQVVGISQYNVLASGEEQLSEHAVYVTTEHTSEAPAAITGYLQ